MHQGLAGHTNTIGSESRRSRQSGLLIGGMLLLLLLLGAALTVLGRNRRLT